MTLAVGKQSNRKQGSMFKKLLVLKAAAQVDMAVSNVKYNIQHEITLIFNIKRHKSECAHSVYILTPPPTHSIFNQ